LVGSAPAYTAKITQWLLMELWLLVDWPPYSPDLNPLDFDNQRDLQAKVQAMPHSNLAALGPSIATE
jgi:hypothetical protein